MGLSAIVTRRYLRRSLWYKNVPRAGSPGYLKGLWAGSPWHTFVTRADSLQYIGLADYRVGNQVLYI